MEGNDVAATIFHPKSAEDDVMSADDASAVDDASAADDASVADASAASPASTASASKFDNENGPAIVLCHDPEVTVPTTARLFVQSKQIMKAVKKIMNEIGTRKKIPPNKQAMIKHLAKKISELQEEV